MPNVKIRALRPFVGVYGRVKVGDEIEVSEAHAKRYHQRGLAVPTAYKMAAAHQNKMEAAPANKAVANPSQAPRHGSPTGAAKPSSSSRGARQPKPLTSRNSEDDAA